ncbi:MAG: hypothetical protein QXU22_04695 [Desulfurococcaceae archaeon]
MRNAVFESINVKDLDSFIKKLQDNGYVIVYGPHAVLEDHSEISVIKIYKGSELVAIAVAHYISQYYRAVISESYVDDKEFLERLLEIRYSGEKWSIPVNPVYVILFDNSPENILSNYSDEYPVKDGEELVKIYRNRNPNYDLIPRVVIARFLDT